MGAMRAFLLLPLIAFGSLAVSAVSLEGDWHGESLCQQKNTACRDEKVVYRISAPGPDGTVTVDADKIVEGRAVSMGKVRFHYDKQKETLDAVDGPRVWHFEIEGKSMRGTLRSKGELIRKVELTKR